MRKRRQDPALPLVVEEPAKPQGGRKVVSHLGSAMPLCGTKLQPGVNYLSEVEVRYLSQIWVLKDLVDRGLIQILEST